MSLEKDSNKSFQWLKLESKSKFNPNIMSDYCRLAHKSEYIKHYWPMPKLNILREDTFSIKTFSYVNSFFFRFM